MFTMRSVARASKVDFISLDLEASGIVDLQDGATRFTDIVLRPRLVVPEGTDHARALRMLEKTEKHCLVSASLSTRIRLEPEIVEGRASDWTGQLANVRAPGEISSFREQDLRHEAT